MAEPQSLVELVSRYLPLTANGGEAHGRCVFCSDERPDGLKVGDTAWRTVCCCQNEVDGSDAAGFLMSWSGCSREEAEHQLSNGNLPEPMPVQHTPLRRVAFWGVKALLTLPRAIVWVHWQPAGVHFGREHLSEGRVHLGLCQGRPIDDDSIKRLDGRSCILLPDNRESSLERADELAAKLYAAGHAKVRYVRVQDQEPCWSWPGEMIAKHALEFVQTNVHPYPKLALTILTNALPPGPSLAVSTPSPDGGAPIAAPQVSDAADTGKGAACSGLAVNTKSSVPAGAAPLPADTAGAGAAPTPPKPPRKARSRAPERATSADQPEDVPTHRGNGSTPPASLTPPELAQAYADQTRAEVLGQMVYRKASSIRMRATDWLWPGKIPLGEICVIQGDPGLGKSQITSSLCAIITTGGLWPVTRERCQAGSVVILSAEDSAPKTIVPRLKAAGADLERVTLLQAIRHEHGTRGVSLLADMLALDMLLAEHDNPMAVIVDPISAYQDTVGSNAKTHDSHKNTDVRSLLRPVAELVDRHNVTMILINHLTKGTGRAITRGQGNMAFVAGPRAVWQVSKDKDDPRKRLFLPVKNNLADDSEETGLSFSVESIDLGEDDQGKAIKTSRIMWNDERVTISADEASGYESLTEDERGSVRDAQEFLREALAECRLKAKDVERLAKNAGHNASTLGRAKRALGVISEKEGFGATTVWFWRLKS